MSKSDPVCKCGHPRSDHHHSYGFKECNTCTCPHFKPRPKEEDKIEKLVNG